MSSRQQLNGRKKYIENKFHCIKHSYVRLGHAMRLWRGGEVLRNFVLQWRASNKLNIKNKTTLFVYGFRAESVDQQLMLIPLESNYTDAISESEKYHRLSETRRAAASNRFLFSFIIQWISCTNSLILSSICHLALRKHMCASCWTEKVSVKVGEMQYTRKAQCSIKQEIDIM